MTVTLCWTDLVVPLSNGAAGSGSCARPPGHHAGDRPPAPPARRRNTSQLGHQIGPTPLDGRATGTSPQDGAPRLGVHAHAVLEGPPMSQSPSTPYVLAGEKVEFPDLAARTAIKNSA